MPICVFFQAAPARFDSLILFVFQMCLKLFPPIFLIPSFSHPCFLFSCRPTNQPPSQYTDPSLIVVKDSSKFTVGSAIGLLIVCGLLFAMYTAYLLLLCLRSGGVDDDYAERVAVWHKHNSTEYKAERDYYNGRSSIVPMVTLNFKDGRGYSASDM